VKKKVPRKTVSNNLIPFKDFQGQKVLKVLMTAFEQGAKVKIGSMVRSSASHSTAFSP
jgi:hypothetical protein